LENLWRKKSAKALVAGDPPPDGCDSQQQLSATTYNNTAHNKKYNDIVHKYNDIAQQFEMQRRCTRFSANGTRSICSLAELGDGTRVLHSRLSMASNESQDIVPLALGRPSGR
jgi:hypothetical protein